MEDPTQPAEINTTVRLFNDVYFDRTLPQATCDIQPWAPFSRLPPELRLHVWRLFLQQHRMIELGIRLGDDNQDTSLWYTARNHLGRIVSGRGYTLEIGNLKGGYSASLSPLLWVNREVRQATLHFYRVHLPFPGLGADRVLYLNPEYDVLYLDGEKTYGILLPDFLHDVRAYDPKGQGVTHLAISEWFLVRIDHNILGHYPLQFTPADLHPAAAASFADIVRHRLRSVLCVVRLGSFMRGIGEPPPGGCPYHFTQTFTLRRRGNSVGAFSWLETDPRLGVELDLPRLPFTGDPRRFSHYWTELEKAFGISERAKHDGFRLYLCPSLGWPDFQTEVPGQEGSREELAQHLLHEQADWLFIRRDIWNITSKIIPGCRVFPRHGPFVDAETFEMMEKAPSTAIGMWLFPPEAFGEPNSIYLPKCIFDMSAARPGLFLFEV